MQLAVEVDQSGKIGDTGKPTVIALANGKEYAILIPASVKRSLITELRRLRKADTVVDPKKLRG